MKVTSKTLQSDWYQALAQFGDSVAARALVQLICLFDSAEGYYFTCENCGDFDLIAYFVKAGLVENHDGVFTSAWLQREYIRHAGKAKARRNKWETACLLTDDELLDLGIIPARESDDDEPFGEPLDIPNRPDLVKIRLRSRRTLHIYRVAPRPTPPAIQKQPAPRPSQAQKLAAKARSYAAHRSRHRAYPHAGSANARAAAWGYTRSALTRWQPIR